jgi:hypothetical protein
MQHQLIGHNSLHNTLVACVQDVIKPIKMYKVKKVKLSLYRAMEAHRVVKRWGSHSI